MTFAMMSSLKMRLLIISTLCALIVLTPCPKSCVDPAPTECTDGPPDRLPDAPAGPANLLAFRLPRSPQALTLLIALRLPLPPAPDGCPCDPADPSPTRSTVRARTTAGTG